MLNINGELFASMVVSAANNLESCKQEVNDMNVFPVPDGDTGTNMAKTMMSASAEAIKNPELGAGDMAKAVASAALRGARGNSGVILSQLLRGLAKGFGTRAELDVNALADGVSEAAKVAYRAVMKPTEGTILTVARLAAEKAEASRSLTDVAEFMEAVTDAAKAALAKTPSMLPVLKKAGVVDAGGMGLVKLLEGALYFIKTGTALEVTLEEATESVNVTSVDVHAESRFTYCTEFIILKKNPECSAKDTVEGDIKKLGDCALVIDDEGFAKVHVHTDNPGLVLQHALKIGQLTDVKIDNMKEQQEEKAEVKIAEAELKKYGFVGVCAGEGLADILKDIGVDYVIEGGQTMNPSADDVINAVKAVPAETVFVFPNNKNIILAARQAAEIEKSRKIVIIPTKNVPQNITAMLCYNEDMGLEDIESAMCDAIGTVKTASVTYAVRDSESEGITIKSGDMIGVADTGICCSEETTREAVLASLKAIVDQDEHAVISVYYGEGVSKEEAEALCAELEGIYDEMDVVCKLGGQPVYYYILSAE